MARTLLSARTGQSLLRFHRLDHHELAHGAFVHEFDPAGDFGEERVVFAAADVEARFHPGAPLPHDDSAAGNDLPPECLEAQPL